MHNNDRFKLLTGKQQTVVRLLFTGATSKVIAPYLNIKESGVREHLTRIYKKLEVKSRKELLSKYYFVINPVQGVVTEEKRTLYNSLTVRRKDVARLTILGNTVKQSAERLNIKEKSVKDLLTRTYKKLNVRNSKELITQYYSIALESEGVNV